MFYKCIYNIKNLELKEPLYEVVEKKSFHSAYNYFSDKLNSDFYEILSISEVTESDKCEYISNNMYIDYLHSLEIGDYIEGTEFYGHGVRIIRGWINRIDVTDREFLIDIQADDRWSGVRGTSIYSKLGPILKMEVSADKRDKLNESLNRRYGLK